MTSVGKEKIIFLEFLAETPVIEDRLGREKKREVYLRS